MFLGAWANLKEKEWLRRFPRRGKGTAIIEQENLKDSTLVFLNSNKQPRNHFLLNLIVLQIVLLSA